jgi:hypothetical protein
MAPNFEDKSIVMTEQGGIATVAFKAIYRTIDSIAKL